MDDDDIRLGVLCEIKRELAKAATCMDHRVALVWIAKRIERSLECSPPSSAS